METPEAYRKRRLTDSYWPADTTRTLFRGTLGQALRETATAVPDRLALVEGISDAAQRRRWTYAQLLAESERVASALLRRFKPGERIAVWAPNVPEWVLLTFGSALAGIILVTVNPAYKARELDYVLRKSGAAGLFLVGAYRGFDMVAAAAEVRGALPDLREIIRIEELGRFVEDNAQDITFPTVEPLDPCIIMFTSGTTGAQKGVIFNHRGVANMANFTQERGGLAKGGVFVNPMPMFHIGALGHAGIGAVMRQATHVLVQGWDPALFMSLVESERGTYSLLVPTMIEAMLAHPERKTFDLSSFKNMVSGAAVVEADLIRRTYAELGCSICNIYGQTEMQGNVTGVHRDDTAVDQAETIGQSLPHMEIKIADPQTGEVLPLGAMGEICVRGYQSMLGYFSMPEETAKTLKPDGWLHSGDLGSMDERGFIKIRGRIKDMIIRGGENIYPREIENVLTEHPKIANVSVIGVPDTYWGEQVGAVIILASPADKPDLTELSTLCRAALAHYKTPKLWYFVTAFPMTETGKVQKFKLVEAVKTGALKPETL